MKRRILSTAILAAIFIATGVADGIWTATHAPTVLTCATWAIWGIGTGITIASALLIWADHAKRAAKEKE